MGLETWLLLVTVALLAWAYSRWRHSYWSSKGVASPPTLPFIGHFHKLFFINKKLWEFNEENYKKYYESSMHGLYEFFKPILMTWDPEIIKHVLIKDFDHFNERRDFNLKTDHERDKMMLEMLVLKTGTEWKNLRAIMSPTFTSGKIKSMFPLVCDKADALVKYVMKQASENPRMDMKRNFGRYTMDSIASCAFGIECNTLLNEGEEFTTNIQPFLKPSIRALVKGISYMLMPNLFKLLGIPVHPKETDFFIDVVKQNIAARQAGQKRGDFLDLLLEARDNSDNPDSKHVLSDNTIVAQSLLFIMAGYESTSSLLAFTSFLLAKNKHQQQRLRDEVRQVVAEHGGITYQGIMEAKFLDACLQESLRLYPPGITLERTCTKTFTLPGTDVTLKPGSMVQVPIWSLHHDPRHWPDPEAFIPDRFLPENKNDIHPFTHMPFGTGPRNCIAMRFALMEAKVGLAKLLLKAELELVSSNEELILESMINILSPKDGVMLLVKPLKEE